MDGGPKVRNGEKGAEEANNEVNHYLRDEERDKVQELEGADKMTSISQVKPTASQFSKLSGKTYIS